jgi:hypothetical protein
MRCLAPFLLFLCASATAGAQITVPPPDDLLDAGHCLATSHEDWLGLAQTHPYDLELGYVDDPKASHGNDLIYIVHYTTPTHTEGVVYTLLAHGKESLLAHGESLLGHDKDSHRVLQLQYRTAFRQSDDGSERLVLVDPPLGGIWTQDRILSAIHQVGFHTWTITVTDLQNRSGAVQCEAESDVE